VTSDLIDVRKRAKSRAPSAFSALKGNNTGIKMDEHKP